MATGESTRGNESALNGQVFRKLLETPAHAICVRMDARFRKCDYREWNDDRVETKGFPISRHYFAEIDIEIETAYCLILSQFYLFARSV